MLKVKEVSKKYVSKRGNECDALQGVSFDLPEKGLFFILGKSGSGKSTLLNLLGGLDTCTGGEIILNGLNVSKMDAAQLDVYRNEYLGFIFQEFNLIENLSVGENVSLPLSLQSVKAEGQVEAALEEVGLSGMGARFPDELSGGQKQRVAIARALIKNPEIILADEPTGNLDSETGKDIFELLVNLSKSKLIIVVSHDAESAEKYGDGIIHLQDGKIIKNTCSQVEEAKEEPVDLRQFRSKLPDRIAFKMGFSNLLKKKVRSISCLFIAIFTILSIAVSQMILSYSPEYAIYRQSESDGISHIVLQQGEKTFFGLEPGEGYIPQSTMSRVKEKCGAGFLTQDSTDTYFGGGSKRYIESAEELTAAGYAFVGEHLPLKKGSAYISEEYLEYLLSQKNTDRYYVYEDGEFVKLDRIKHNKDNIIGKTISFTSSSPDLTYNSYVIAGIVATAENKVSEDNGDLAVAEKGWNSYINGTLFAWKGENGHIRVSYNDEHILAQFGQKNALGQKFDITFASSAGQFATDAQTNVYSAFTSTTVPAGNVGDIFTENGILDSIPSQLGENEVIISYHIYKALFPDAQDPAYYAAGIVPEHLNEKISFSVKESQSGYGCKNFEGLILKGVCFNFSSQPELSRVVLSVDNVAELYDKTAGCKNLIVNISEVKNLHKFLKDMRKMNVNAFVVNSGSFYNFEVTANQFGLVFIVLSCVLSLILLLFVINLISVSIKNQQKEIGILRALGARSKDIFKIYIFESLLLAVVPCVVCFGAVFLLAWLFNKAFTAGYNLYVNLLFVNWLTALIIIGASVVLIGLATVIPLRKIVKMRPIDAIKNL